MRSESRREAILEAMTCVVGRKGYLAATVADAIEEAGASRATFYKHFDDKHDCFLAAYDVAVERVLAAAAECDGERPWLECVRGSLESVVDLLAAEPELARFLVVEGAVAGGGARRRQWAAIARLALMLEAGRERNGSQLPANVGPMAVGAAAGLLFDEIQAGRIAELRQQLPDLMFALLVPYLGPRAAAQAVRPTEADSVASR